MPKVPYNDNKHMLSLWKYYCNCSRPALEQLFKICSPDLVYMALSKVNNCMVAEDIVQEVFANLMTEKTIKFDNGIGNCYNLDNIRNFRAYVTQTTINKCMNYHRNKQREVEMLKDLSSKNKYLPYSDDEENMEYKYQIMNECIKKISNKKHRDVILMCFFENKIQKEIAEELDISYDNVRRILSDKKKQLMICVQNKIQINA